MATSSSGGPSDGRGAAGYFRWHLDVLLLSGAFEYVTIDQTDVTHHTGVMRFPEAVTV
jgi:hypothetical protein